MNEPKMTDREMDAAVRTWMQDSPTGQPDRSRVVGNVISRLGSTRRRPRRWWPFSILRSKPTTAKAPERQDGQPDPIRAPEDHTATVTGRTHIMFSPVKAIILGAIVAVGGTFLVAQPFQQESTVPGAATEATDAVAAQDAALATGRRLFRSEIGFESESESPGLFAQRGRTTNVRSEMSDARLSGDVVIVDNADRFFGGDPSDETYLGDVLWGTIEIANDGGTWAGTMVGTTDTTADGGGVTYYELVGSGGYEGLSAVIFEREGPIGAFTWNGIVFPGDLPPDR